MSEIIKINNPFRRTERQIIVVNPGETIQSIRCHPEVVKDLRADVDVDISINGQPVPREQWPVRRIKQDEFLLILPKVAGGDEEGKAVLNVVMMIALYSFVGPGAARLMWGTTAGLGAFVTTVAVVVGGAMAISALTPHPKAPSSGFVDDEQSQVFGWNPATIQRQGIPVPRFYGLNKLFGNVAAAHTEAEDITYEETTITEMYHYWARWGVTYKKMTGYRTVTSVSEFDPRKVNLYALFSLGIGPIREPVVEGTLKLNDQPAENFDEVYYETRRGNLRQKVISYFEQTKLEVVVGRLIASGSPVTYETTNGNFNGLVVELSFPGGLYDGSGADLANYTVNVTVEVKKTTSSVWQTLVDGVNLTDAVGNKKIFTYPTAGIIDIEYGYNYQIRVTKNTADKDDIRYGDILYLDKVREVIDIPFTRPRRALVGVKALATNQLYGSIRFSCLSRGLYVRVYDGESWSIEYTNNPAWVIYDILTQPVFSGATPSSIDLKLLLNFDGADGATSTTDSGPENHTIYFDGTAQLDTAEKYFGTASLLLDGDSDGVYANHSDSFNICENITDSYTVDLFVKHTDHDGDEIYIGHFEDYDNGWNFYHRHGDGLRFGLNIGGVNKISVSGGGEITDTNWHHVAMIKVGKVYGLYLDGVQVAYAADTDIGTVEGELRIGRTGFGAPDEFWFDGSIDHVRLLKGNVFNAVPNSGKTDTFDIPTESYPDTGAPYAVERYDGYDPSKLNISDFEDLADWCDGAITNPTSVVIIDISQAIYAVVTTNSKHNFGVGDVIVFRGVDQQGMVEITDGTTAEIIQIVNDYTFAINLDTSGYTAFEGAGWLGIDSSSLDSSCNDDGSGGHGIADALDGLDFWKCALVHLPHWVILDLGESMKVAKIRLRSNTGYDPKDVDIYVSDTKGSWGDAVAEEIDPSDTASPNWVETSLTPKTGRYVYIVINSTEDIIDDLEFGAAAPMTICDISTDPAIATVEKYKPRFEFNGGFDTETDMWEAALRVCELCRCVPYWSGDQIHIAIDKLTIPSYAFTMGNIVKGTFREIYIPVAERAGEIEIHYRNAQKDYERQPFILINSDIGNATKKMRLDLFGITDADMAERIANHKLLQNLYIKKMIIFEADIEAIACVIGDVIKVQHDVTNWGCIG